jgi:hypothetical protein
MVPFIQPIARRQIPKAVANLLMVVALKGVAKKARTGKDSQTISVAGSIEEYRGKAEIVETTRRHCNSKFRRNRHSQAALSKTWMSALSLICVVYEAAFYHFFEITIF